MNTYHFTHNGRAFTAHTEADDTQDAPWDREDGHGPVRRVYAPYGLKHGGNKRPGERVLHSDHGAYWLYDWHEAARIARRDGWGPTLAHALDADFKRLQAWCEGYWHYVGVIVTPDDGEDEPASLWGIESDCEDYLQEVAHQLAAEFAPAYVHVLGA